MVGCAQFERKTRAHLKLNGQSARRTFSVFDNRRIGESTDEQARANRKDDLL